MPADRAKKIIAEMSSLLEQQKKILGSSTKLLEMSGEAIDEYSQRYERLRQLARELVTMA